LIIYIYGNTKFKKEIKSLLLKSGVNENINDIASLDLLKSTIKNNPKDIFLIDDAKIIHNKILHKINFFKPKDSIEKEFLDEYGVGDICFNTINSFVQYILARLDTPIGINIEQNDESIYLDLKEDTSEDISEEIEIRDLENIICIDDIFDSEMEEAIDEFKEKNK